jgi:hypothetical protein
MKTAMQEHIDWLKSTLEICEEHATPLINCLKLCISDAESKLEMEKEQIVNAFEIGYDNGACVQEGSAIYHGSNYYNETFKSE